MKFLIADDSDFLRTRLINIISEIKGVEVVGEFADSREVPQAVINLSPDVVILDIQMPGGSGYWALESIKKMNNPPTLIMLADYPYLQYRKRGMDLGADYFFYKAFELEKLVCLIRDLIKDQDQD